MGQLAIWLLIGAAAVVGIGGYLFARSRRPKEEPVYHFNCPSCRRRLRYRAKQVGHPGQCPQCKKPLTFPAVSGPGSKPER